MTLTMVTDNRVFLLCVRSFEEIEKLFVLLKELSASQAPKYVLASSG